MAIKTVPSASVLAKAAVLLSECNNWRYVRNAETGHRFIAMPSGDHVYAVHPSGDHCTCKAAVNGLTCSHAIAARERANQIAIQEWLDDEADSLLEEYEATQAFKGYQAVLTLARLGGFCVERGCQNDSERGEDFCRNHQLAEVY